MESGEVSDNRRLIEHFYQAFSKKDFTRMQSCYRDDAVFSDEVFRGLDSSEVRAMWEMLLRKGKDLHVDFRNIKASGNTGSAEWVAVYTYSKTKRKVVNHVKADFVFEDSKILRHLDHFDFYRWTRQAFGLTGTLLGWTGLFKRKVQRTARNNLAHFISRQKRDVK